ERVWDAVERDGMGLRITLSPALAAEQVTVTATRTETRLGETAASVAVLSDEALSNTAALTLDDALRQVAGFQLFRRSSSRNANPTTQGVSLRGVGASGASRSLVLLDGLPLNDPFGGWVYWSRVPRASVSRIEVLRGGASSLYGSAALGGVINILARQTNVPTLALTAAYGNQSAHDVSIFAGGRRGSWDASIAAESFSTDGYRIVDERERGLVDTPAGSRHATVDLSVGRRFSRQGAQVGRVFLRGLLFGEARTNGTPLQTNRTHLRQLSAGADWETKRAGAFTLRAYGGTQVFDQNFSAISADRSRETLTRVQRVPSQSFGLTSQWSRAFGARHTLVAGAEAREVRGASDEIVFVAGRPSSLVGAGGRERTISAYLEDIIRVTPRLIVNAVARVDTWRNYAAQQTTRPVAPLAATTSVTRFPDRAETAFSPQLSALYQATDALSFNVSAYRAFRQPTLNELYRSFRVGDVLTFANEKLQAERLTGGEAGASLSTSDRRFNTRATFFWTEITRPVANVTLRITPTLITRQRQNLGRTRSRGVELEAEARLNNDWTLSGGYQLVDATVVSFPASRALEGLQLPQVARHQFTFQLRYFNPSRRWSLATQGRAAGAQFDDDQNRFRLARFSTLDFFAARRVVRHLEVFAAVENVFDRHYAVGRTPVTTIGPPRLARIGVRLRFGAGLD
ncbi:MAG: TonB-dependent receptor, partial [Acidobacteria bacterium]|nr:TonB-dependent receptor [Acidobacteriota bacterium]